MSDEEEKLRIREKKTVMREDRLHKFIVANAALKIADGIKTNAKQIEIKSIISPRILDVEKAKYT
jgi:hypothetical protein